VKPNVARELRLVVLMIICGSSVAIESFAADAVPAGNEDPEAAAYDSLVQSCNRAFSGEKFDEVLGEALAAEQLDPSRAEAYALQAMALFRKGDSDKAKQLFSAALMAVLNPNGHLASSASDIGKPSQRPDSLDQNLAEQIERGISDIKTEHWDDLLLVGGAVANLNTNRFEGYAFAAIALYETGDIGGAIRFILRATSHASKSKSSGLVQVQLAMLTFQSRSNAAVAAPRQEVSTQPIPLLQTRPVYPKEMKKQKISGGVLVDFIVDPSGNVKNASVTHSTRPEFEAPALEAVNGWKFSPGTVNGQPVFTHMQVPLVFDFTK
jgi:TonB family protein